MYHEYMDHMFEGCPTAAWRYKETLEEPLTAGDNLPHEDEDPSDDG